LNLPYDKAIDDKELPATLNHFFRLYLVCPLYRVALLSLVSPYHLGMRHEDDGARLED